MSSADGRRFDQTRSPATEAPAARRFGERRMDSVLVWVRSYRRESAAAIIALMMIGLMWETPPQSQPAGSDQPTDYEAIDDLFAEMDSAAAAASDAHHVPTHAVSATQESDAISDSGDAAPLLRIPAAIQPTGRESQSGAETASEEDSTGKIRFSGLLHPSN